MRVLVFRTGALGDVVLTLPVFESIRASAPDVRLHLVGRPNRLDLASASSTSIHDIDAAHWAPWFTPNDTPPEGPPLDLVRSADVILSYLPDPDGAFAANLRSATSATVLTHPPRPPEDGSCHAVDHLLAPLSELGIPVATKTPSVSPAPNEAPPVEAERLVLAVHPGSGGRKKCWMPENFASVADRFVERTGGSVVLTGGPADGDLPERIAKLMTSVPLLRTPETPRAFAGLLATCSVYLGNDSGPTHLAAAVGAPVVVLFGPTSPQTWGPRGRRPVTILHDPDLSRLPVDRVWSAAEALLPASI